MKSSKAKGLSIFQQLLSAFLGLAIILCSAFALAFYIFNKSSIEARSLETISQQLSAISDVFDNTYRRPLLRSLRDLTTSILLNDFLFASSDEKLVIGRKLEIYFRQLIEESEIYDGIYFVDANGDIPLSGARNRNDQLSINLRNDRQAVRPTEEGPSWEAARRLFHRLSSGPVGAILLEGPYPDQQGRQAFLVGKSKLDLDTGKFGGAVVIRHRLDPLFAYLGSVTFFGENPIWAFSPGGTPLHKPGHASVTFDPHPHLPQAFQATPDVRTLPHGIVASQDLAILPSTPFLRIAVSLPTSLLLKDMWSVVRFFLAICALVVGVICALAFAVSRYLSRPIVALAAAANRLAHGNLSTRVEVTHG